MKLHQITCLFLFYLISLAKPVCSQVQKPTLSIDEFFNATEIHQARLAPNGVDAVIQTIVPDWQHDRFRNDLWLWQEKSGKPTRLTQSGCDSDPEWSSDGKYIAFLSERALAGDADTSGTQEGCEGTTRVWLINPKGGEAFPLYIDKLEAHSFAWATDASAIYFSIADPLSKEQEDANKSNWKDVIRWREQERGDVLLRLTLSDSLNENLEIPTATQRSPELSPSKATYPKAARVVAHSEYEIEQIAPSPAGNKSAFSTRSISHREERPDDFEIYIVDSATNTLRQLTHNQALETDLKWSVDGKRLYFHVGAAAGSVDGNYHDLQGRLFAVDPSSGVVERLGEDFNGSWQEFAVAADNSVLAVGQAGTESQIYSVSGRSAKVLPGVEGTYSGLNPATDGKRMLFKHSAINEPVELYVTDNDLHLSLDRPVTDFNALFTKRAIVQWRSYSWIADDGVRIEGVLIYPPRKLGEKQLHMLTLIHGGPADADGNYFGADWYDWALLAAQNGWLVFRPNYRGSSGYGDEFMAQIAPHLVSRPGKDILEGVDSLVKDGIADPQHLTIGGYSYGGYMTNWLITQTTRFKAAVTGAGAVEHAANWGNDDLTLDDAWYLGGTPWQKPDLYQSEAALFQFGKVTTPTHLVAGNADVRVSYLEGVLLERALENIHVPHSFLVFPGEGHSLEKNPWHGYIKVREELKWLQKYDSP